MILVMGATGTVGGELLRRLAAARIPACALTRNLRGTSFPSEVEVRNGDPANTEQLRAALAGVKRVFFMAPHEYLPRQAAALAGIAKASGVHHIVMLSSLAVELKNHP